MMSASIHLRPTRIALLTRPTDRKSIRRFLRACSCLWGGAINPIIPVFRTSPRAWRDGEERLDAPSAITRGYIKFYEPDIFIEAEDGLASRAGLSHNHSGLMTSRVLPIDELFGDPNKLGWVEPQVGLGINDAMAKLYQEERRFHLRTPAPAFLVEPNSEDLSAEALFGVYPDDAALSYIREAYNNVFTPMGALPNIELWRKVFIQGAYTPNKVTMYGLHSHHVWNDDLKVFIFDPSSPLDIIDFWNMKLETNPLLPVPVQWVGTLVNDIEGALSSENRALRGNRQGASHEGVVEFGRSLTQAVRERVKSELTSKIPPGTIFMKNWRTRVWAPPSTDRQYRRRKVTAGSEPIRIELPVQRSSKPSTSFATLSPDFAASYGGGDARWVNALQISYSSEEDIATILPFTDARSVTPTIANSGPPMVTTEGWIYRQAWKNSVQHVQLLTGEQAIANALKDAGITAALSDPGHVAKQMLNHLGGINGIHLLRHQETIHALNQMAGGVRRKGLNSPSEEVFDRRSKPVKDWTDLISKRSSTTITGVTLDHFTTRDVLKLGLTTCCPNCQLNNWHGLNAIDYTLTCERCQRQYAFPQANLQPHNRNWAYRVAGPFAVPDFGRGSYGSLLALHVLATLRHGNTRITYSTAMTLRRGPVELEADYIAWWAPDAFDNVSDPLLVIGEAKSSGRGELLKSEDFDKLRRIGELLPGCAFVISVLRDQFTAKEKALLARFVKWCRKPLGLRKPHHDVLLLTSNEIFYDFDIARTWEKLGPPFSEHATGPHKDQLRAMAQATQSIYLGLPPYHEQQLARWRKIRAKRSDGD